MENHKKNAKKDGKTFLIQQSIGLNGHVKKISFSNKVFSSWERTGTKFKSCQESKIGLFTQSNKDMKQLSWLV